jgi:hypothetical protein
MLAVEQLSALFYKYGDVLIADKKQTTEHRGAQRNLLSITYLCVLGLSAIAMAKAGVLCGEIYT